MRLGSRAWSLEGKLAALLLLVGAGGAMAGLLLPKLIERPWIAFATALGLGLVPALWLARTDVSGDSHTRTHVPPVTS